MRNIFILSYEIGSRIPADKGTLRLQLEAITERYKYRAPELWRGWFNDVAEFLNGNLGTPDAEWKKEIQEIFADRKDVGA